MSQNQNIFLNTRKQFKSFDNSTESNRRSSVNSNIGMGTDLLKKSHDKNVFSAGDRRKETNDEHKSFKAVNTFNYDTR